MIGRRLFCISYATISALLSGVAAQEDNVQLIDNNNNVTTLTNLTEAPSTASPSSASPSTSFAPTLHPTATPTMRPTYFSDLIFKVNETEAVDFDSMRLHPGNCDEAHQYCIDVPAKEEGETADSLSQKFRRNFPNFSDAWLNHISAHIRNNFDTYMSATELGISDGGSSSTVSSYSIGVVIDNYYGMDYLHNKFKVDMKIYIREIEETTTKTLAEVRAEAYDVNSPAVVEMEGADGHSYHELLTKPWDDVKSERRYKNAIPKRNTFCSIEYHNKMKMISESDYKKKFGSGIVIQHSTTVPSPVVDPKGDILYLKAFGAQISFTAPNERF